ncbi:KGK domain-containing protein [Alkalinema pantanalense CENA528]|uniref:KGK domain-containing protein n=1 Tax=Alkalinema pantanalense TaxID=1620705 RepID=UPI003D700F70
MQEFRAIEHETEGVFACDSSVVRITSLASVAQQLWLQIARVLGQKYDVSGKPYLSTRLFTHEGVPGQIMTPSSNGWVSGRMRLRVYLEFCPDESDIQELQAEKSMFSDSVLDAIRSEGVV